MELALLFWSMYREESWPRREERWENLTIGLSLTHKAGLWHFCLHGVWINQGTSGALRCCDCSRCVHIAASGFYLKSLKEALSSCHWQDKQTSWGPVWYLAASQVHSCPGSKTSSSLFCCIWGKRRQHQEGHLFTQSHTLSSAMTPLLWASPDDKSWPQRDKKAAWGRQSESMRLSCSRIHHSLQDRPSQPPTSQKLMSSQPLLPLLAPQPVTSIPSTCKQKVPGMN